MKPLNHNEIFWKILLFTSIESLKDYDFGVLPSLPASPSLVICIYKDTVDLSMQGSCSRALLLFLRFGQRLPHSLVECCKVPASQQ